MFRRFQISLCTIGCCLFTFLNAQAETTSSVVQLKSAAQSVLTTVTLNAPCYKMPSFGQGTAVVTSGSENCVAAPRPLGQAVVVGVDKKTGKIVQPNFNNCGPNPCATYTPVDEFSGYWFTYPANPPHDPNRCNPSLEPPAYLSTYCPQSVTHYQVVIAGFPAKAGDNCRGSADTIGDVLGRNPTSSSPRINNITELVWDTPWNTSNGGFVTLGFFYHGTDGSNWFQGNSGISGSFGVTAQGVISFAAGASAGNLVFPVPTASWASNIFAWANTVTVAIAGWANGGYVHSRACFTQSWDGSPPTG